MSTHDTLRTACLNYIGHPDNEGSCSDFYANVDAETVLALLDEVALTKADCAINGSSCDRALALVDRLLAVNAEFKERLADAIVSDAAPLCAQCQAAEGTEDAGDEGMYCEPCAEAAAPYDGCGCGDFACPCGAPVRYGR